MLFLLWVADASRNDQPQALKPTRPKPTSQALLTILLNALGVLSKKACEGWAG